MNDPFSVQRRKYMPWSKYRELVQVLQPKSLIHAPNPSVDQIKERVLELEKYESEFGFVYNGERLWLHFLESGQVISYSDWIWAQFNEVVFADGMRFGQNSLFGECWTGSAKNEDLFFLPPVLADRSIKCGGFGLSLVSNKIRPSDVSLEHGFEILHNLAYYLELAYSSYGNEDVALIEIGVSDSTKWTMLVTIDEYGTIVGYEFEGDELISSDLG